MAYQVPVIGHISFPGLLVQAIIIYGLYYFFQAGNFSVPFFMAAISYSTLAILLRNFFANDHRKGISKVMNKKFGEAIPYFEKSIAYFSKYPLVDSFRMITMLSSSRLSYKEMGLSNIAFCYSQVGNGLKAREYYQQVLSLNPNNGMAITGLNMLNSLQHLNTHSVE